MNHKRILPVKTLLVSVAVLLLSACGGSGGGASGTDGEYVGSRASATLNRDNTLEFTPLLYGQTQASVTFLGRSSSSDSSFNGILSEINTLKRLVGSERDANGSALQARTVSEVEDCTYGGTLESTGDFDESAGTGAINITLTDCEEDRGIVLNGAVSVIVESSSDSETDTININGLSVMQNGVSYSQTGVLTSYWNDSETHIIETLNLVTTNNTTSDQSYLQDFYYELKDDEVSLSGKLYLSGEGHVTISGSSDLSLLGDADSPLPGSGFIYLKGSNGSIARISGISGDYERFTLELDEDGDGIFEATSIQDLSADELTDLVDS